MILHRFDYQAPDSVSEACSLLRQANGRAAIMAGGTDLIVQMKQKTKLPELVIGLKKVPELRDLKYSEMEGLKTGAMVSLHTLANSQVVKDNFPVLLDTALSVGASQHQFMGTVGGNLCLDTRCLYYNQSANRRRSIVPCHKLGGNTCHAVKGAHKCYAVYSADLGSVLFALGASIVVQSTQGERVISLEDFFTGDSLNPHNLQRDEIITEIIVPPRKPSFARYYKLRSRKAIDFPQAGVALIAFPENKEYRVVVNAVAGQPVRFKELEAMLSQEKLSEKLVSDFTAKLVLKLRPAANVFGSPTFRRKMVGVFVERAFAERGVS